MKFTYEELEKAGYRVHTPAGKMYATALWQKWVWQDDEPYMKLYAINIYEYPPMPHAGVDHAFAPEARFYGYGMPELSFNVEVATAYSLQEVEDFFSDVFMRLYCVPDPHNND